jgi:sulfate adenylyltransferase
MRYPVKELLVQGAEKAQLLRRLPQMPSWDLTQRQLCDLELLLNGGFSPLEGFLGEAEYHSVCQNMRLKNGALWAMPITLDVNEAFALELKEGEEIVLRDGENIPLAVLKVGSIWKVDKASEAKLVYGTDDRAHPAVAYLHQQAGDWNIGGSLKGLSFPIHYDFKKLRHTPNQLRETYKQADWQKIISFQTRNPMHKAHYEMTLRAVKSENANLLLHPVVGMTKPGDIDHYTRVRCYQEVIAKYPEGTSTLSLLPLAMRMAGPKEALWHAQIRKNYGATHFIVGRDHAGPGKNSQGRDFYEPYAAQQLVEAYKAELGIKIIPFKAVSYVENTSEYKLANEISAEDKVLNISGTEFRQRLRNDVHIPDWFSFSEVINHLKVAHPSRHKQGYTVFFTGLSGSGKSTIANALQIKLLEHGDRPVTLLDGDVVRKNLSSELGFSKAHRDLNIQRISYVATEITKHRGIAICAPIAPYAQTRDLIRGEISEHGGFIEVHVSTPIEVCEQRDRKGLYKKARLGLIKGFTGIDDPYEIPKNPEVTINASELEVEDAVQKILSTIAALGYDVGNQPLNDPYAWRAPECKIHAGSA